MNFRVSIQGEHARVSTMIFNIESPITTERVSTYDFIEPPITTEIRHARLVVSSLARVDKYSTNARAQVNMRATSDLVACFDA